MNIINCRYYSYNSITILDFCNFDEEHLTSCSAKKLFKSVFLLAWKIFEQLYKLGKFEKMSNIVNIKKNLLLLNSLIQICCISFANSKQLFVKKQFSKTIFVDKESYFTL